MKDDEERFCRVSGKMNRFTAYILMPAMGFLAVMAQPIFHCLFGEKWDASVVLFQLLLARGVFTVLTSLYNNYLVAKAQTKTVVAMEGLRDGAAMIFLLATLPWIALTKTDDPVWGIKLLLYGQLGASALTWGVMAVKTARVAGRTVWGFVADILPYLAETAVIMGIMWVESLFVANDWMLLGTQAATGLMLYLGFNGVMNSVVQGEVISMLRKNLPGKPKKRVRG